MTTTINASTSSGLVTTPDNSGAIALQSNGTTITTISSTGTSSLGVSNGSSAATGQIGEFIESAVGPISVTTATAPSTNMTSITLTAGDWELTAVVQYYGAGGSASVAMNLSTTSGSSSGTLAVNQIWAAGNSSNGTGMANIPKYRQNITSTTTYYLNAWLSSTNNCYGYLCARRVR